MNDIALKDKAQEMNTKRLDILNRTKNILIERLNLSLTPEQIDDDSPLFGMGLGLDSIDSLELVVGVEEEFGIQVGDEDLEVFLSVNSLVDFILQGEKKKRGGDIDLTSADSEDKKWLSQYKALRESALVYDLPLNLLEIPEGEKSLLFLAQILAGKDLMLEPQKSLHTMLLNHQGAVVDLVYVMMFDEKFWISFTPGTTQGKAWFSEQAKDAGIPVKDVTSEFGCVVAEGPYSWKLAKPLAGFEVTGLGYLHFMNAELQGTPLIIFRAGVTNEYGFRIIHPAGTSSVVKELFKTQNLEGVVFADAWDECRISLDLASREVRFPTLDVTVSALDSPVPHELRWMADFSKEAFIGSQALNQAVVDCQEKVMAFIVKDDEEVASFLTESAPSVTLDDEVIGKVLHLQFSPAMGYWFGYALLNSEWAFGGNDCYCLKSVSNAVCRITTQSTPLFLTQSALVQME